METPLEPRVEAVLNALFPESARSNAVIALKTDCGPATIPGLTLHDGCERVRLAALKLSNGDLDNLHDAIAVAQTDYRDLLMAAGFGSPGLHVLWADAKTKALRD